MKLAFTYSMFVNVCVYELASGVLAQTCFRAFTSAYLEEISEDACLHFYNDIGVKYIASAKSETFCFSQYTYINDLNSRWHSSFNMCFNAMVFRIYTSTLWNLFEWRRISCWRSLHFVELSIYSANIWCEKVYLVP